MDLSLVIANRNDTIMLNLTIVSILEAFKAFKGDCEIVLVDNSDKAMIDAVRQSVPPGLFRSNKVRWIQQDFSCLFTARETGIKEAKADVVMCIDSHMLLGHNIIKDSMEFMSSPPPRLAFAHPPCSWAERGGAGRHYRDLHPQSKNADTWFTVHDEPRKMSWKGMPWLCYKDRFKEINGYGVFAEKRLSWGGGDFYLAVKPWLLGFENWAIPTGPGIHIGPYTKIRRRAPKNSIPYKYRVYGGSGTSPFGLGAFIGYYVLGGEELMKQDPCDCGARYRVNVKRHWDAAKTIGREDKAWLDERKVMSYNEFVTNQPWND